MPYWPSSGKLILKVTRSPVTKCDAYFASRFSSDPFLCRVAIKSVSGRDMRNWHSNSRPAKINASWCVMGTRPKSRVAFIGPHSPLAQSGRGTMTVWRSSQTILNLQTLLNFMGSPVRYSRGVTALAKMSSKKAPLHGAWTRNATTFPTTDYKINMIKLFVKKIRS